MACELTGMSQGIRDRGEEGTALPGPAAPTPWVPYVPCLQHRTLYSQEKELKLTA